MKIQFFSRALPMATCALLLTAGLCVPLRAQTLALDAARAVGNLRFSNGTSGWTLYDAPSLSALSVVPLQAGEVVGVKRALQLDVHAAKGSNPWDIQLGHELAVGIANGEAVRLSFWGKADKETKIGAGVELGSGDYQKLAFDTLTLSPTWKHYEVIGRAARDFAPGQTHVTLQLGAQDAKITLAGMRVEDPDHPLPPAVIADDVPFKVRSLVPSADFSSGWSGDGVDVSPLPADDVRGGGVQLTVKTKPANPWEARFDAPNAQPISGGDTLALRVWARSPTKSTVAFFFQQSVAPYEKLLNQKVVLTPDWKEYRFVTGISDARDFAAKGTNFEMHVGYDAGTIEVRNARVENYGDATIAEVNAKIGGQTIDFWGSRPHDDGWREAALQRIERFRKANLRVRVVDGKGNSVRGAKVSLTMTRHAFRWGTAVTSAPFWNSEGESARKYKQLVLANFNTIVLENGMKWPANSPAQQEINDAILSWAKQNNIEVRGHNLVWGSTQFMPPVINGKSLAELSNDELRAAIEAHVRDYVRRFKGRVYVWDAVNEAVAERDIWERVGWDEFTKVFQIAREEDPNVLLAYNDYNVFHFGEGSDAAWKREQEVIQKLVDAKAPFDIVAEQAHLGAPLLPIPTVLANLQEAEKFGKPIEITEYDLGLPDARAQADYFADFLTACFSDPNVVSFVQWGFWEGAQWRAKENAHLVNRDFSFKPAMQTYRDLVYKSWWTNASGQTDVTGAYSTRGFKGDYALSASKNGKTTQQTVRLDDKTGVVTLVLS